MRMPTKWVREYCRAHGMTRRGFNVYYWLSAPRGGLGFLIGGIICDLFQAVVGDVYRPQGDEQQHHVRNLRHYCQQIDDY